MSHRLICPLTLRAVSRRWAAPALCALLSACAGANLQPPDSVSPPQDRPAPLPVPAPQTPDEATPTLETHAVVTSPVIGGTARPTSIPQRPTNVTLLAYADRVRSLSTPELAQELARLAELPEAARLATDDLQLALALGQTRVPSDLVRAQALLQRVLANNQDDVRNLHPLARLLAARYAEQKRLEEQVDKQAQQLRDSQRRIDQLNERLEAMRAIERSLTSRSPAAPHNNGGTGLRPAPAP